MTVSVDEPVGVLGVGVEGRATIEYLLRHGVRDITALDRNEPKGLPDGLSRVIGPDHDKNLSRFAVVFRSPGIRPDVPALVAARESGTKITSAISYFLEHCPSKVVGITGTLGKGTASALTAKLLEAAGFTVHLGGNIGKSPLDFLDDVRPEHRTVLEISSFQAMDVSASPQVGVILKTTSEHLDWHRDRTEYRAAKSNLFAGQSTADRLIYNADSEGALETAQSGKALRVEYSLIRKVARGVYLDGRRLMYADEHSTTALDIELDAVRLPGTFNLENLAAAVAAALESGAGKKTFGRAAERFEGLAHRLQFVAQASGIRFYNDSYATRPDATLGAVASFTDAPLSLILGGSEKYADFTELVAAIRRHPTVSHIALIGQTAKRLHTALAEASPLRFSMQIYEGLTEALDASAAALPTEGGTVLLSPACASFGLFPNYKVRGERFEEAVHRWIEDRSKGAG